MVHACSVEVIDTCLVHGRTWCRGEETSSGTRTRLCVRHLRACLCHSQELERLELKAELYEKLGGAEDLERAEEVVQGLVRRSPDQWSYYVSLLDLLDKRSGG